MPGLVVGTQRIATIHRKLAERVARNLPLAMCEVPFEIPPIREAVQWHITSRNDFAIQWVVGQLRTYVQENLGTTSDSSTQHDQWSVEFEASGLKN